jgi:hypothetical protein
MVFDTVVLPIGAMMDTFGGVVSAVACRFRTAVWEVLFNLAVTVALWLLRIVPAVATNVTAVVAADTVIDSGTISKRLLLEIATAAPPIGAGPLNVTVQIAMPNVGRLVGRQVREIGTSAGAVTTPPVGESAIALPEGDAASVLLSPIVVLVTPEAIVRLITARVPFEIMLAFMPEARQV